MNTPTVNRYKLRSMPSAMCHVIIEHSDAGAEITLRSYYTDVLKIMVFNGYSSVSLFATGTYSVTTARHINRFTTEFFGVNLYHEIKQELDGHNGGCFKAISYSSDPEVYNRVCLAILAYERYGVTFHDYTKSQVERFRAHLFY